MRDYFYCPSKLEIKSEEDGLGIVKGYGAYFDNNDAYDDVILKGAFSDTLKNDRQIRMLSDHNMSSVIGVWNKAYEDDKGLVVEGQINLETAKGKEIYALVKQGAISGLSIGFKCIDCKYEGDARIISKLDLYEVSFTAFPVNEMAQVTSIKSENIKTERDFEKAMSKIGFSKSQSKILTTKGFKALGREDSANSREDYESTLKELTNNIKGVTQCLTN